MTIPTILWILAFLFGSGLAQEMRDPTVDGLLSLSTLRNCSISPDGSQVAYTVSTADFEEDVYSVQLWLADVPSGATIQLTRGTRSVSRIDWSPDGRWISFRRADKDGKEQIWVIPPNGGEGTVLTRHESGISSYEWAPDGKRIAFLAAADISQEKKDRRKRLGAFTVVKRDLTYTHLWSLDVQAALDSSQPGKALTSGTDFSIVEFSWSPDSSTIAYSRARNGSLVERRTKDIDTLDPASGVVREVVTLAGPDGQPLWSPDGKELVFVTANGRERFYPHNNELARVAAGGGTPRVLTGRFDEMVSPVSWEPSGIYFWARQGTSSHLFRLNPTEGDISRVSGPDDLMASSFSLSSQGRKVAFLADSPTSMLELYVADLDNFRSRRLTRMTDQVASMRLASRELIQWQSRDGATIEGVLHKPADFDPTRKYALLCIIHGGPTGIDRPGLLSRGTRYYPADIWSAKGALVLRVNYRGSAGYGEDFRALNIRNLGVGDAWDVLSGVDHLIEKGWVDPERVGCMGWSQGGYISAFLTASSDRFAAISVGAGISNWSTYYYNTDITSFTIHYLGDTPAADPEIYRKTSPMTYIQQAGTPTLIQHGEFDRRVPIPNAYELRQGLEDQGVPVEMVVYHGFGHGIDKPRSMRAVMEHNLAWFNHYLWGGPRPSLQE